MSFNSDDFAYSRQNHANVAVPRQLQLKFERCHKLAAYPFRKPPKARANKAIGRFGAKPNMSILIPVPARPVSRIGFRPTLSLSHPQKMLAENSAIAKIEVTSPV